MYNQSQRQGMLQGRILSYRFPCMPAAHSAKHMTASMIDRNVYLSCRIVGDESVSDQVTCTAAGNPFAPPGTLRSRPVSPVLEPAPRHERSLSLQAPDLPVPASAALADYASSLSLPHPSHTVRLSCD